MRDEDLPPPSEVEDFGEGEHEAPSPEPEKETIEKQEPRRELKDPKISLDIEELNHFLSEVSRLSVVIERTSKDLKSMESKTAIVEKLRNISDMDLSNFRDKFEALVKDLDLEKYAREAIKDTLAPIEREYKDTNDLLKNFIFELEKTGNFKSKVINKCKLKSTLMSIFVGVAIGAGGLFLAQNFELPKEPQEIVQSEPKEVEIFIKGGTPVLELKTNKRRQVPTQGLNVKADNTNAGYFEFQFNGIWYRVPRTQATVVDNGNY